jgi:hypothetical protein
MEDVVTGDGFAFFLDALLRGSARRMKGGGDIPGVKVTHT